VIGRKRWAIPGGRIPFAMGSYDVLRLLNAGRKPAEVEITIVYEECDPIGPYRVRVEARRLRHVRINDLIDPLPVTLEKNYSIAVRSDRPVVVQFTRRDSSAAANAITGTIAYPAS
jgi:hypothetical protein